MANNRLRASGATAGVTFAARLTFEDIHLSFGETETLRGVTLTAEPGEILCLLGPSGSGKTSLLRIAAGIQPQTSGRVLLNEREIAGPDIFLPPEKRSIGLVFQDFALFPHMSILENVRFGLTKLSVADGRKEALHALRRVGLEGHAQSWPHVLSGGEQQRVALARALVPRPSVLLLDEPFSGLDTRLKDSVRAETLAILRETRATAIMVTHDAEEAMRMGDRIALMDKGKVVQAGRAEDIYHRPQSLFVAGFFAELNVFAAAVSNGVAATPLGPVPAPGFRDGDAVSAAIRTTDIRVETAGPGTAGRVIARRFVGESELLAIAIQGSDKPVNARIKAGILAPRIADVTLSFDTSDVLVFETGIENA